MKTKSPILSKKRIGKFLSTSLTLCDWLILNLSLQLTNILLHITHPREYLPVMLVTNLAFITQVYKRYKSHSRRTIRYETIMSQALGCATITLVVMLALSYLCKLDISYIFIGVFFLTFCLLLIIWSLTSQNIIRKARKAGYNFKKAIIIGSGRTAKQLLYQINNDQGYGIYVKSIFDNNPQTHNSIADIYSEKIRPLEEVIDFATKEEVNIIYFTLDGNDIDCLSNMMHLAEQIGAQFTYIPKLPGIVSSQFSPIEIGQMHGMVHQFSPLTHYGNRILKRIFDLCVSVPFTILSPLIFIPIAIGIKISSPGPIFFRQKRTGLHGKDFFCLKFRTMKVNTESDKQQATKDDPRKTKFGNFLRKTSLDELPQFYNVLLGDMTVVGPRPHMVSQTEEYSKLIDKYMVRHAVKPGITGWAQVRGYRGATEKLWQMEKRVEHDVWYISNWSLLLDIKIMFLTVFNQLKGEENAY